MISKRLIGVSYFTKGFDTLLDVGTDHGFLPIYALKNGLVSNAIASDVNEQPLLNASTNIIKSNLSIETILYDGIPVTKADVISVCGMGGELIIEILEKSLCNARNLKRLILAPNTDSYMVREYICNNGFILVDEAIIKDKNHYYEVLVLEKGNKNYSPKDLYFGPFLLKKKNKEFKEKYMKKLCKLESIVSNITEGFRKEKINEEIKLIKELFCND